MFVFVDKRQARMPMGVTYERFSLYLLTSFSRSTQKTYERAVKRFITYCAPKYTHQITIEHIEQFVLHLKKDHKARTINLYLAGLKHWLNWLDMPNVAQKIKCLKTLPPHRRLLTKEEYDKVIAATEGYMQDCIRFLACTGLRASELLSLTPENVQGDFLRFIGKGQKQCTVPLCPAAKGILESNPSMNFLKSRNRVWLFRLCRRAAKLADIPPFSPHTLRHFFADELHRKRNGKPGLPIDVISKLMNHSSPSVTASVYIHWRDDDLLHTTDVLD